MSKDKELLSKKSEELKNRLQGNNFNFRGTEKKNIKRNFLIDQYDNLDTSSGIKEVKISNLIPAPAEWNFYKQLSDSKTLELIDSILNNGLLQPIVIWEQENKNFMILAGHNRVRVFKLLYESTKNEEYLKIPALIKQCHEITEEQAREIIIDTNWVSRQLSSIEKSKSISIKYSILQNNKNYGKYGEGRVRDTIAEEFKISGRQVESYRSLEKLIPELKFLLENGKINFTPATKLTQYSADIQRWIYSNFSGKIENKYTKFLKSHMTKNEIESIFSDSNEQFLNIKVNINIPKDLEKKISNLPSNKKKELENIVLSWLHENA